METYLKELRFISTAASHAPALRSMKTHVDGATERRFNELVDGGRTRDRVSFADIAPSLMSHDDTPQGNVHLEYGFGERRFIVMAQFETKRGRGRTDIDTFLGYTDMVDVTSGGHIANATKIFLNSHTTYRLVDVKGGRGTTRYEVTSASNILVPALVESGNNIYALEDLSRPEDLVLSASRAATDDYDHMVRGADLSGGRYGNTVGIRDLREEKVWGSSTVSRAHNLSSNVLYDVVDSYSRQRAVVGAGGHQFEDGRLSDLLDNTRSNLIAGKTNVGRSEAFRRILSDTSYGDDHLLTVGQLIDTFPEARRLLNDRDAVINIRDDVDLSQYTDDNNASNPEAVVTNSIVNAVTSAMAAGQFGKYAFIMSNYGTDELGDPIPRAIPAEKGYQFLSDGMPSNERERRSDDFLMNMEITLDPILRRRCDDYELTVHATIAGMINIEIRMDDQREYTYAIPAYCDSLFSGVFQPNAAAVTTMASDITRLLGDL